MPSPEDIFRTGSEVKQSSIQMIWPELYDALAGLAAGQNTVVGCVIGDCPRTTPRPLAVARLTRMGHPACKAHVDRLADRPGGWPLPAADNYPERKVK